jgi:hypothetical protein
VQDGQRTLLEVTDKAGRSWKVGSVEGKDVTTYFVVNSGGQVDIMGTAFDDRLRAKHAIVYVDSSEKEEALAVLDRKFLSGVSNASEPYRNWLNRNAVFTYGSVNHTRRIDIDKGGLGLSDIRVEEGVIVGRIKDVRCHCSDMAQACIVLPSPWIACVNKICDLINCTIGVINGDLSDCSQENSDAQTTCELAAGVAQ